MNVQECDATGGDSSNAAKYIKIKYTNSVLSKTEIVSHISAASFCR